MVTDKPRVEPEGEGERRGGLKFVPSGVTVGKQLMSSDNSQLLASIPSSQLIIQRPLFLSAYVFLQGLWA